MAKVTMIGPDGNTYQFDQQYARAWAVKPGWTMADSGTGAPALPKPSGGGIPLSTAGLIGKLFPAMQNPDYARMVAGQQAPVLGGIAGGVAGNLAGPAAPIARPVGSAIGGGLGELGGEAMTGQLGTLPPGETARRMAMQAAIQGGLGTMGEVGAGLANREGTALTNSAFNVTPKMVERFPNMVNALKEASPIASETGAADAVKAWQKAARTRNSLLSKADATGWSMTADQIAPDPETIVPPRTHNRDEIVASLNDLRKQFIDENPGDLKPSDLDDIRAAHAREGKSAISNVQAGMDPAMADFKAEYHRQLSGNAGAAIKGGLFPGGIGQIPSADEIAGAQAALRDAIGVKQATKRAADAAAAGRKSTIGLTPPPFSMFWPKAIRPVATVSPATASRLAAIANSPLLQGALRYGPQAAMEAYTTGSEMGKQP